MKFYDNTTDDNLLAPPVSWMSKNKSTSNILYISNSKVNDRNFPSVVKKYMDAGIELGIAYSSDSEVDNLIAYNKKNPNYKLKFAVTEYEDYNTGDQTYYANLLKNNSAKLWANGLKSLAYQGWSLQYDKIVKYTDELLLHSYRTSAQMIVKDDSYNYCKKRLAAYAAEAKLQGKKYPFSVIFSCEPTFGMDYFKKNSWDSAYNAFLTSYNALATSTMKQWLVPSGGVIFVSKYALQSKP